MKNVLSILFLSLSCTAIGQSGDTCTNVLTNSLIAYYPFSGNVQDQSGNGNNGTVMGANLTTDRFGRENSAYSFNGSSDFIEINRGLQLGQNYTVSVWINTNTVNTNWQSVIGKYESFLGPYWFGLHLNKASMWVSNGFFGYVYFDSDSLIQTNKWIHLVWTGQGTTGIIYINGVKSGTKTIPAMTQNNDIVTIGKQALYAGTDSYCWFNGKLDDIRIYNRTFSQCEVKNLYKQENTLDTKPLPDLLAWYLFSTTARDSSGNNFHGTINGGAQFTSDRFGQPNKAILLDGINDFVSVPDNDTLDIGKSDYSILAWIKTDNPSWGRIVSKGSSNCETGYMLRTGGNSASKVHLENAFQGTCYVNYDGTQIINDNGWHCVAGIVKRDSFARIYIDALLDRQVLSNTSSINLANNLNLSIGVSQNSFLPEWFRGAIDEVKIYSRVLSLQEISNLCNSKPNTIGDIAGNHFSVFPNPSNSFFTIKLDDVGKEYRVRISNITGKTLIETQVIQQELTLDISDLPVGLYIIEITNERTHDRQVRKFVKN